MLLFLIVIIDWFYLFYSLFKFRIFGYDVFINFSGVATVKADGSARGINPNLFVTVP